MGDFNVNLINCNDDKNISNFLTPFYLLSPPELASQEILIP